MNKEEIWSKTRHFIIETPNEKLDLIDTDVYLDLLNKYNDLQRQLEEKDKVINDALNFIKEKIYQIVDDYYDYYEKGACFVDEDLDKLLEILERGKDD